MRCMTLYEWLKREGLTHADFAERIGLTQSSVTRYVTGSRVPRRETMIEIARATNGEVAPADFGYAVPMEAAAQ